MRTWTTILAIPAALVLTCGCNGKKDQHEAGTEKPASKPAQVPVAGTGTLVEPTDPADPLYTRTYAILPAGDITFTGSTAGVAVFAMGDGTRPERKAGLVLPGSVSGIEMLGPQKKVLAASTGPTGVALVDVGQAQQGTLSLLSSGQWSMEASCHAAWKTRYASEGRIFVACGTSGVMEADVGDPARPRAMRLVATGGYVRDLAVLESRSDGAALVVAAAGSAGITILSFPVSGEPQVVGRLDTQGDARALTMDGDLAYVADGPNGLVVVDLADPAAPKPVAHFDPHERDMLRGIIVDQGHAYLCMGNSGLVVLDVSAPQSPSRIGAFETDRAFNHAAISGTHLLGANDDAGLLILDVSNPASLRQIFPADG